LLGVFVPAGTAATVIAQLKNGMNRALSSQDVRDQMAQQGAKVAYGTPGDLLAAVKTDLTRMAEIVKAAKIEAQ
jgi:tripartite-type tricarboxylate transporter receptor subunit TctC